MGSFTWEIEGREFGNCNCSYGCPCQFNGLPTYGNCCAIVFYEFDRGYFREIRLDGLRAAMIASWPGAVHEGKGKAQYIIDERADEAQREALYKILSGQDTEPFTTMWNVFAQMCDTIHPPIYAPIEIEVDIEARRAKGRAGDVVEIRGEPILNPVTGAEHRARIQLPHGFEYEVAEIGRGWSKSKTKVPLDLSDSYGQFCHLHLSNIGVVREKPGA